MRQGLQSTFKHKELKDFGCYFFTLCAWVHLAFGIEFSDDDIIEKFNEYKKKDWIGPNCWIKEPIRIFNDLAKQPGYFKNVTHSNVIPSTRRFPVFFQGKAVPHFALGHVVKGKVEILWDSWYPSALQRGLAITNYRLFT